MEDAAINQSVDSIMDRIGEEASALVEIENVEDEDSSIWEDVSNAISQAVFERLAERIPIWILTCQLDDDTVVEVLASEERALAAAHEEAEAGDWETNGHATWINSQGGVMDVTEGKLR